MFFFLKRKKKRIEEPPSLLSVAHGDIERVSVLVRVRYAPEGFLSANSRIRALDIVLHFDTRHGRTTTTDTPEEVKKIKNK